MRQFGFSRLLACVVVTTLILSVLAAGLGPAPPRRAAAKEVKAAEVQSFSSEGGTAIPTNTQATVYPLPIEVSGFETEVTNVAVHFSRFSHTWSDDVDMLLVGPEGQNAIIWSDAGGVNVATNLSITLDDRAANALPIGNAISSGTFRPQNGFPANDTFPVPAPNPSGASALAVFNGTDPNGTWRLFIVDDGASNSGSLQGVSLLITTANGEPEAKDDSYKAKAGKKLKVNGAGVLKNDSDPDNNPLTAKLAAKPKKGKVSLKPDGTFTYKPKKGAKGPDRFTYKATDPDGEFSKAKVRIKIK